MIRKPANVSSRHRLFSLPAAMRGALLGSATANRATLAVQASGWGWLPELSVLSAAGILVVSIAHTRARSGASWAELLFWSGFLIIVLPIALRLASHAALRQERVGLVVLLMMALYLTKVMHSPVALTFSDELIHLYNVEQIQRTQHLFSANALLPVTPLYPGLGILAAMLSTVSGLTPFAAGLVVVGTARLIFGLAFYLFCEQVSQSQRVAGLAVVFYTANSNFVFWSAQFAYESVALPAAMLVLCAVARRTYTDDRFQRVGLTAVALAGLMLVVPTHHMTSYATVVFLITVSLLYRFYHRGGKAGSTSIALIALVSTVSWLVYVASFTIGYLSPVLTGAIRSMLKLMVQEEKTRELFRSAAGYVPPQWERTVGLLGVGLLLLGLPFGLWAIWRRYRHNPYAILLAGTALAYFAAQVMRLTGAGWETANRASEYLFVGLGFVLALGVDLIWPAKATRWIWPRALIFVGCVAVIFISGVLAGWPPGARMARPYQIAVGAQRFEPQGVEAANWLRDTHGVDNVLAADQSNARLMLAYGLQFPYTGGRYGIQKMIQASQIARGEKEILQLKNLEYVVLDRRVVSWDNMIGIYYYKPNDPTIVGDRYFDPQTYKKFDRQPAVSRLFDSGDIAIYDVRALSGVSKVR